MGSITINRLLVLENTVRERLNELKALRSEVSKRETYMFGSEQGKTIEPQYDVKKVDAKMVQLSRFLFDASAAIKTSNATTEVSLDFDVDKLLEPIQ